MKFNNTLMSTAALWAEQSHCKRRKVGAVLSKDNRILCTGYNGSIPGEDNCCEDSDNNTLDGIAHAEQAILTYAARNGIATNNCTMYITLSPCIVCARLMIQAGINKVFYQDEYRITDGIELLTKHNVYCKQLKKDKK